MALEWYYTTNKQQMGPVSWDELRQLASKDLLKPDDLVWTEGMAEWVKAVRQQGLFQESVTSVKAERADTREAPPRKSSARQRIDDELDDFEDEERRQRRKTRKGSNTGLKIGLIVGAVVFILLVLGCGLVGVLAITLSDRGGPAVVPAAGGAAGGFVPPGGGGAVSYNINLAPGQHNERVVALRAGQAVTITVRTNRVAGPVQPDVDLHVLRRGQMIASDIRISPDCNITFVVPGNDNYTVRVSNLGPGFAASRVDVR